MRCHRLGPSVRHSRQAKDPPEVLLDDVAVRALREAAHEDCEVLRRLGGCTWRPAGLFEAAQVVFQSSETIVHRGFVELHLRNEVGVVLLGFRFLDVETGL
eukprot:3246497-Prorocentrum_lima.AAC.1